jgi:N,N'-diacetyllegionaminate synthase
MPKTFIIAEAGINHNGSVDTAKKMIDAAVEAGADAVKFQTYRAEQVVSVYAEKAEYQKRNTAENESPLQMLRKLELDEKAHRELANYCRKKSITFLSSPFDLESVELLDDLGLEIFKIPSGEITNLPYLRKIGGLRKKIILSTGMAELEEIRAALDILVEEGTAKENITLLHCNTQYPTPIEDVNLRAMLTLRETFGVETGYSDHTRGIEVSLAAVALGASVIEKHFTLDRDMEGPDHKASLEPDELKTLVTSIRNIEIALGDGVKKPSASELKNRPFARKSIVALKDIKKGEILAEENITAKRPGSGLSPMRWPEVVGKPAKRNFKEDELLEL